MIAPGGKIAQSDRAAWADSPTLSRRPATAPAPTERKQPNHLTTTQQRLATVHDFHEQILQQTRLHIQSHYLVL